MPACLLLQQSQQMQCLGTLRVGRKHLAIASLRQGHLPSLLMF
jgi:hypothetical protein